MTIASEVQRIKTNIANAYTACNNKGATMPVSQESANLASCVSSIPTATEPTLASLTVTPSTTAQTLTPPSGTDGYNTVQVSAVTASIDSDIVAGNIKSGVNILGVTGNYSGTTPTGTYTITVNGTYDVTNYASANVSVSGGGGSSNIDVPPYNCLTDNESLLTISTSYGSITNPTGDLGYGTDVVLIGQTKTEHIEVPNELLIEARIGTYNCYLNPMATNLTSSSKNVQFIAVQQGDSATRIPPTSNFTIAKLFPSADARGFDLSTVEVLNFGAMTEVRISNNSTELTGLKKLLFPKAISILLTGSFRYCTNLSTVYMPKVNTLPSMALAGSASAGGAFSGCTSLTTLSFPALTSTSFGSYTNQFNYMLKNVTGCTVHFPSNLQSVIGSWTSVTGGFSGTNTTVLFDLPTTT